jgi:hypothetical protein
MDKSKEIKKRDVDVSDLLLYYVHQILVNKNKD